MTDTAQLTNEELRKAIAAFLSDYSIECTPHDEGKLDEIRATVPPGTAVYVAHPPGVPIEDIVKLAGKIQKLGFRATPHIIARKLESRGQLEQALAALQGLGVDHALCVAGDITAAQPAFDSSLEVLETGLFSKYGFREIGVAGHPEGSKAIGEERVEKALRGKAAFAKQADFKVYFATQFGFDPEPFIDWEAATNAKGITMPIHVGMPGPASLRQLAKFAMLCGVGASMRILTSRTSAMVNLLSTQAPDEMVTALARHRATHPDSRMKKVHFFAFGGVVKTARWANAVASQRFVLNKEATGFRVEDN
jgi:methylenetetrahydrofolate reductase (NADPH)